MAKFNYNNVKNAYTRHMFFELNYSFHPQNFYKRDINSCFWLKLIDELVNKFTK